MTNLQKPSLGLIRANWNAPKRVHALFTLRTGGVSSGPFGGLDGLSGMNVGLYCGDVPACVRANRAILAGLAGGEPHWLRQVHGTAVVQADHAAPEQEADGLWTAAPGVVLAIQTADCLPVVLADSEGRAVAALHAGWKGLAGGILQKGVKTLRGALGPGARILAWLAPRIGPESFEVGGDVLEAMEKNLPQAGLAFAPGPKPGKWMADLACLAREALAQEGVAAEDVSDCGLSTAADPQRFFSYRRDKGRTGRHATLVWMEP